MRSLKFISAKSSSYSYKNHSHEWSKFKQTGKSMVLLLNQKPARALKLAFLLLNLAFNLSIILN